jgi:hypothetical protein
VKRRERRAPMPTTWGCALGEKGFPLAFDSCSYPDKPGSSARTKSLSTAVRSKATNRAQNQRRMSLH